MVFFYVFCPFLACLVVCERASGGLRLMFPFWCLMIFLAEEVVNVIVEGGAIPALVKHLQAPPLSENDHVPKPFEHEVEKGSAFALGLLAVKVA